MTFCLLLSELAQGLDTADSVGGKFSGQKLTGLGAGKDGYTQVLSFYIA